MKRTNILLSTIFSLGLALPFNALAGPHGERQHFEDYGRVEHVEPVYKYFEHRIPHETCWNDTVRVDRPRQSHHDSTTSTLVGGVIGGAIGHAVGHGKSNKKLGAVVGSVIGMSVGRDIGERKQEKHRHHDTPIYKEVERCDVRYTTKRDERLVGYDVTYKYKGERYTTFMQEHPGKRIRLAVSVQPVAGQ